MGKPRLDGVPSCESGHSGLFRTQLQQIGNRKGIWGVGGRLRGDSAGRAGQALVGLHARLASMGTRSCKVAGDSFPASKVHLTRCLAGEGSVWKDGVVLLDVECDQPFQGGESIELMQVEPAVLGRTAEAVKALKAIEPWPTAKPAPAPGKTNTAVENTLAGVTDQSKVA